MNASAASRRAIAAPERWSTTVVAGLVAFAAVELGLAIFMALAPHRFYIAIGPFGARNDHYVRDVASYNAALGAGLLFAVRHASWRVPVLAITTIQFALHGLNHLLDISSAHPAWVGYFDFFALAAATVQLAWLTWLALKHPQEQAPTPQHHPEGGTS